MGNLADVCMSTPSQQALHESQTGELDTWEERAVPGAMRMSLIPAFQLSQPLMHKTLGKISCGTGRMIRRLKGSVWDHSGVKAQQGMLLTEIFLKTNIFSVKLMVPKCTANFIEALSSK